MYDTGKIIIGIVIFLVLFSLPFWYSHMSDADEVPEIIIPSSAGDQCIEDIDYMRGQHMDLLMNWRDDVVRGADKAHEYNGEIYDKSLTDTCLEQCHTNKADFCDECHSYVSVEPDCWDCHNIVDNSAEGE